MDLKKNTDASDTFQHHSIRQPFFVRKIIEEIDFAFPIFEYGGNKLDEIYLSKDLIGRLKEFLLIKLKKTVAESDLENFISNCRLKYRDAEQEFSFLADFEKSLTNSKKKILKNIQKKLLSKYFVLYIDPILIQFFNKSIQCEDPVSSMMYLVGCFLERFHEGSLQYKFSKNELSDIAFQKKEAIFSTNLIFLSMIKMLNLEIGFKISLELIQNLPLLELSFSPSSESNVLALRIFQYRYLLLSRSEYMYALQKYVDTRLNNVLMYFFEKNIYCSHVNLTSFGDKDLLIFFESARKNQTSEDWRRWFEGRNAILQRNTRDFYICLNACLVFYLIESIRKDSFDKKVTVLINSILEISGKIDLQFEGDTPLSAAWRVKNSLVFNDLLRHGANIVTAAALCENDHQSLDLLIDQNIDILSEMIEFVICKNDAYLSSQVFVQLSETNLFSEMKNSFLEKLVILIDPNVSVPSVVTGVGFTTPLISMLLTSQPSLKLIGSLLLYNFQIHFSYNNICISVEDIIQASPFLSESEVRKKIAIAHSLFEAKRVMDSSQPLAQYQDKTKLNKEKHASPLPERSLTAGAVFEHQPEVSRKKMSF